MELAPILPAGAASLNNGSGLCTSLFLLLAASYELHLIIHVWLYAGPSQDAQMFDIFVNSCGHFPSWKELHVDFFPTISFTK